MCAMQSAPPPFLLYYSASAVLHLITEIVLRYLPSLTNEVAKHFGVTLYLNTQKRGGKAKACVLIISAN